MAGRGSAGGRASVIKHGAWICGALAGLVLAWSIVSAVITAGGVSGAAAPDAEKMGRCRKKRRWITI